jgi:hypothetical protein
VEHTRPGFTQEVHNFLRACNMPTTAADARAWTAAAAPQHLIFTDGNDSPQQTDRPYRIVEGAPMGPAATSTFIKIETNPTPLEMAVREAERKRASVQIREGRFEDHFELPQPTTAPPSASRILARTQDFLGSGWNDSAPAHPGILSPQGPADMTRSKTRYNL